MSTKLLCEKHPVFYFISVREKRIRRYFEWYLGRKKYAKHQINEDLRYRVKKHRSVLIRKLGVTDIQLQFNKITNLKIAIKKIDGIIIKPGETFSFCKLVGLPTRRKGYLPGMELSRGEARPGIGGGLCQIANMLHWLVLHSPLTIVERHHHSFDPFPDDRRVLPFGSGATIFFNYLDFQFTNNTNYTFQIHLWISKKHLRGELRVNQKIPHSYHVFEKNHRFLCIDGEYYRANEIWRKKVDRYTGKILQTEKLIENFARVKYVPQEFAESELC